MAHNILAYISGITFFPNRRLVEGIANNINFHYRTNSGKINDKVFIQIEKTLLLACFWPISPIFWGEKKLPQKIWHAQLDKIL